MNIGIYGAGDDLSKYSKGDEIYKSTPLASGVYDGKKFIESLKMETRTVIDIETGKKILTIPAEKNRLIVHCPKCSESTEYNENIDAVIELLMKDIDYVE